MDRKPFVPIMNLVEEPSTLRFFLYHSGHERRSFFR